MVKLIEKKDFSRKNPAQFVPVPAFAKDMHVELVEKMDEINKITNDSDFNVESDFSQNKKYCVIASSSAYNYAFMM